MNYLIKKVNLLVLAFAVSVLFISSCSEDSTSSSPAINESQVLAEYLEANGDFVNTAAPPIIKATDVNSLNLTSPETIHIMDLRSPDDYAAGHINNAVNVAVADLLTHAKSVDLGKYDKAVLVCYTGQTASFSAAILRMAGYENAYTMKWGMASWNSNYAGKWQNSIGNGKATMLEKTDNPKAAAAALPVINSGKTDGAAIAEARAQAILTEGFGAAAVKNDEVFANPDKYYVINYWPSENYLNFGHIPGSICYIPKTDLKLATNLKTLPTDKTIVVYCYTGQTSASVTAYLRMLGYDAKSLLFGTNGMAYDLMKGNSLPAWADSEVHDFDVVK